MADKKVGFQLTFAENLKKDVTLSSTPKLAFDDLGDFIEERERIRRLLETANEATLRVDYSDFANHVFFDSAVSKFKIAQDRILTKFPYNGNAEEKDAFFLTSSAYENYVQEQWPRYVGFSQFSASSTTYFSASDLDKKLVFGTSSLMISADVRKDPDGTSSDGKLIVSVQSGSAVSAVRGHIRMYFSGGAAGPISLVAQIASGTSTNTVNTNYDSYAYSGSWHNVAAVYNRDQNLFSVYIDGTRINSESVTFGPIEQDTVFVVGGGGLGYSTLSGAIDNVRLYFTASELLLQKHINKQVDSEDYLVLNYRFNEGVVGTSSIDMNVVDYSKSGLHALINNYSPSVRASGTSRFNDPGDPILYSFHSDVLAFSGTNVLSGSNFDRENNNQIFNMIPEYILRTDDEQEGLITAFSLAMARFFDELKLYIDQFDNLRITNYDDLDDTPDIFLPFLTRYFGWKVTEHFGDTNPLSFFFGEGIKSSGSLEVPLQEIRNQFWRRTLNNLPYLLKTKGKRYNLDAYFNVLGINKENINLKEYGYLPGGSIMDTRIHKEKVSPFLGIGTGSLSSSFVKAPLLISGTNNAYTIEAYLQLPFASASYSASLSVLTGSVWQLVDPNQVTGSFALLWNVPFLGSSEGKFILSGTTAAGAGQSFSSSLVDVFDGDFVYVAAGLRSNQIPFIEIRTLDNDTIDFSASFSGAVALSGVFTGSKYDFIIGATSGTFFGKQTQGFFGQVKYWNRPLSSSEITDHAFNFESVGINDPAETPHPLRAHWALNENKNTDGAGNLNGVLDLSRNGRIATGTLFLASANPYDKFLTEYNYLSPSVDLKWTENKIRIRNKDELRLSDVATDTNEVSLEFNLIDALNRDITKIFASFDLLNNAIGRPVNKYRDEYADLEAYRRVYFDRLGDSVHFSAFFNLFRWFDKKLSDSIKQLLPTRVKFIGGEQVVESHVLERPRYGYKYPIFRTPVDIPNAEIQALSSSGGDLMLSLVNNISGKGPQAAAAYEQEYLRTLRGNTSVAILGVADVPFFSGTIQFTSASLFNASKFEDVVVDLSGVMYGAGWDSEGWFVKKSHVTASSNWFVIDHHIPPEGLSAAQAFAITIDPNNPDNIYVCGYEYSGTTDDNVLIRRSTNRGSTWETVLNWDYEFGAGNTDDGFAIAISPNGKIFAGGRVGNNSSWAIFSSSTGASGTFALVDYEVNPGDNTNSEVRGFFFDPADANHVFAFGYNGDANGWALKESFTGSTGSWTLISPDVEPGTPYAAFVTGSRYFLLGDGGSNNWVVDYSDDNGQSWTNVDDFSHSSSVAFARKMIGFSGNLYVAGTVGSSQYRFMIRSSSDFGESWGTWFDGANTGSMSGERVLGLGDVYMSSSSSVVFFGQGNVGDVVFDATVIRVDAVSGTVGTPDTTRKIGVPIAPRDTSVLLSGDFRHLSTHLFSDGDERVYRNAQPSDPPHKFVTSPRFFGTLLSKSFVAHDIAINLSGNLLVAGYEMNSSLNGRWTVYHSASSTGWTTVDLPTTTFDSISDSPDRADKIYVYPASGTIFVMGQSRDAFTRSWTIRSASLGGATGSWQFVDHYRDFGGSGYSVVKGMTSDSSGNLYACGYGAAIEVSSSLNMMWLVRSSSQSGRTGSWGTIDVFDVSYLSNTPDARANAIVCLTQSDRLIVVGGITPQNSESLGMIRTSSDHGATWGNPLTVAAGEFFDVVADSLGNLYTCGNISDRGVIYRSTNSGSTWSEYHTDSSIDVFYAVKTARNAFEEYLLVCGKSLVDNNTSMTAFKISDVSRTPLFYLTGSVDVLWNFAVTGSVAYVVGSNRFAISISSSFVQSSRDSTGSFARVDLPSANEKRPNFFPIKVFGDTEIDINDANTSINYKNYWARNSLTKKDRDNE